MSIKVLMTCLLMIVAGNEVLQKRIQKSGADFTCSSEVRTAGKKLEIVSSVKNNGPSRLSVTWGDAGISCTGFNQLDPQVTDSNSTIAQEPYILDHSEVLFGNALQYRDEARCYVDGQTRPKKSAQTVRSRHDRSGSQIFKIVVTSELDESGNSAEIMFSVEGIALSLILPTRVGHEFNQFGVPKGGQDWDIVKTSSLSEVDVQKDGQAEILRWLGRTPHFKSLKAGSEFIVLRNTSTDKNQISFPISGHDWILQTVFIVAFSPDKPGFVGLAADIHLPR